MLLYVNTVIMCYSALLSVITAGMCY